MVMATLFGLYPFLRKLYADGGYQGPLFRAALGRILRNLRIDIVKRSDAASGFSRCCRSDGLWNEALPGLTAAYAEFSAFGFHTPHDQKTLQKIEMFPDRLLKELIPPSPDHIRADIELGDQLGQRLLALHSSERHLCL
jgi:hypothetical protein